MTVPYVSLADFAATFTEHTDELPRWVHPGARVPLPLEPVGLRYRLEDILDTIVALQRAEWLHDGVYVGPQAMSAVYRDVLDCARQLRIAVPPAIIAGCGLKRQGAYGTDTRAFLYLSSFFFTDAASEAERRFMAGRLCGHIAAHQVTANTLYALVVDHGGIRSVARRAVGPVLEVFLAPLSLGVRLALSRWHRAAEISADRAGLLCAGSLEGAGRALLRLSLGVKPRIDAETYLDQLKQNRGAPGKWAELLSDEPWIHKRMRALELFARSAMWAELTGNEVDDPLSDEELERRTQALLGVT